MATDLDLILTSEELDAKLGNHSGSVAQYPTKSEVAARWGNVFITTSISNGNVLLENGEVWPIYRGLKFGTSEASAYSSSTTYDVNFRDEDWIPGDAYTVQRNTKAFRGSSEAQEGYYMDSNNYYYYVNSNHVVWRTGTYSPDYFTYNSKVKQVNRNSGSATSTYSTNISNVTTVRQLQYDFGGDSGGNSSQIGVSYSGGTATFSRSSYSSSYPFVVVTSGNSNANDTILIHPDWYLSCDDITDVSYAGTSGNTITPSVSTNMGSYGLSSSDSWVSVSGNGLIIQYNSSSSSRSATVTVSSSINVSCAGIDYSESDSTSFTVTQEGKPATMLYVVWSPTNAIRNFYLVDSNNFNWSDLNNRLVSAPQRITIEAFKIHVGLNGAAVSDLNYVEFSCSAKIINTNSNSVTLIWSQETQDGSRVYHQNGDVVTGTIQLSNGNNYRAYDSSGNVITGPASIWMGSAPDGYSLYGTVVPK